MPKFIVVILLSLLIILPLHAQNPGSQVLVYTDTNARTYLYDLEADVVTELDTGVPEIDGDVDFVGDRFVFVGYEFMARKADLYTMRLVDEAATRLTHPGPAGAQRTPLAGWDAGGIRTREGYLPDGHHRG